MRRAITNAVTMSATTPTVVLFGSADATSLMARRKQDSTIAYDDMFVAAVAKTLRKHKYLNASFEGEGIRFHAQMNIGLAVATEEGLLVPVFHAAEQMTVKQISAERAKIIALVKAKKITEQHLTGGTFAITNLGMYPVDCFTALIQSPQAAILSIGRIQQVVEPVDGAGLVFRSKITLGLTLDHRVADGAHGAAFLQDLILQLEAPDRETT